MIDIEIRWEMTYLSGESTFYPSGSPHLTLATQLASKDPILITIDGHVRGARRTNLIRRTDMKELIQTSISSQNQINDDIMKMRGLTKVELEKSARDRVEWTCFVQRAMAARQQTFRS